MLTRINKHSFIGFSLSFINTNSKIDSMFVRPRMQLNLEFYNVDEYNWPCEGYFMTKESVRDDVMCYSVYSQNKVIANTGLFFLSLDSLRLKIMSMVCF